jgi:hypothetical protein
MPAGRSTPDDVIIRNLPLHLAVSARTWLEHLSAIQIHNWDDLVRTFVRNFQGTYVRPENSWDLRACTQKPSESLRDFIRHFSKRCTELPSVAQSEIVLAFLEGTTCRDLVREAGFIKEVFHPTWLANPVLVKKKNGKWRMCVDYTSLNKACLKVPFPLPRIDQIIDSTAGCELLCFLDAYFGYHQIKMKKFDQLATLFITPFGMYCFVTMPFGLRNAGATYQRCMQHVFGDHIRQTVEAYVDDIVMKTRKADDLVDDLRIAFGCLRANGVKLNPKKCVFGVPRGMLLGYIVSQRGIEANPKKVAALERMGPIRDLKGVQKVLGCLAALSRFISQLGEKGLPLYRLLKKHERFSWTVEAQ